ncbi:hypothetical protein D3875_20985 [Deinococcus cavernae]|uniref:Uncharacterized protein n=1 Tax=Deinococcus cavernae TaxID=2320857 RepID=A0A418V0Y2_9DEIO|nr:hypothetical protein [Deinococcus cavernae]RJF69446.1 hypothetical protein D3875_20985 [Deinococcus cavernae]
MKDDGTFTTFTVNSLFTATGGVADAQGRIWSFVTDNSQIGTLPYHLAYWDPATNKIINASDVKGNNYLSEALRISNSGRYILYTGTYDSAPALVDSVNVTTRTIGTSGSVFSRSAVSDTGEVWFLSNSGITRVNQDGTSNTFTLPNDIYSEMIASINRTPRPSGYADTAISTSSTRHVYCDDHSHRYPHSRRDSENWWGGNVDQ